MKYAYQIILVLLFLMVGSLNFSNTFFGLLLFILGCVVLFEKQGSIKTPLYLYPILAIYLCYMSLGLYYGHENPTIDIKFQIFGFLFYLFLVNYKKLNILKFLFYINIIVLMVYVGVYLGVFPNEIWHSSDVGYKGRVYGPSIIPLILMLFYYIRYSKPVDGYLVISILIGIPYFVLTTNMMNLVILALLFFLVVIDFKKLFTPKTILILLSVVTISGFYFNSKFAPELIKDKLPYILKPLEYESLNIRIVDFKKALESEDYTTREMFIGKGFGAKTTIYRQNKIASAWSGFYTFQEIDNGIYYLFHRGGFSLILLFVLAHIFLLFKLRFLKAQLALIIIILFTCILSIHYFNNIFYLIIPFLILEREREDLHRKQIEAK